MTFRSTGETGGAHHRRNWLLCRELTPIYHWATGGGRRSGPFHVVSRRTDSSGRHHRSMKGQAGSYGDS